ncbi:MAG: sulfatase family protein, partial [Actinomycetota bacterium]
MATHPQVPTAPRARAKILLVSTLLTLVFAIASPARARASAGQPSARPNVLLIVTDDQRWDTLRAMPAVERRIAAKGTTFTNGFVVNPLCCPSRASILTGDYSHTTGVYREITPYGRFEALKDSSTIATWLDDAGYTTGLFGKYIDGYQHPALTGYVPPGWDRWVAFVRSTYYDYMLTVDGRIESHGAAPQDYSTNVLARYATDFIRSTQGPLFVEFATAAPHAPAIAPPGQDPQTFADLPPWRPPSYDEADTSDKPAYVRNLPPLTASATAAIDAFRRDQYRTLLDVDRQVGALLDALRATGRLSNTVIIYTSDNGLLWGEHRWSKKEVPYEEAIRVPLLVRYDPFHSQPLTDDHLALNIDIAPTIADLTGVPAPPMDGQSLRPLLEGGGAPWRTDFLIEHMEG